MRGELLTYDVRGGYLNKELLQHRAGRVCPRSAARQRSSWLRPTIDLQMKMGFSHHVLGGAWRWRSGLERPASSMRFLESALWQYLGKKLVTR
jgi:hypothetical protein